MFDFNSFVHFIGVFVLMLSILCTVKELFLFVLEVLNNERAEITKTREWLLAGSLAYILTFILA